MFGNGQILAGEGECDVENAMWRDKALEDSVWREGV